MKAALVDYIPLSYEDQERVELATLAARELDHLRLGRLGQIDQGVKKLVAWLEENFSSERYFHPNQLLVVREALCKQELFDSQTRATSELIEAVARVQITLRGLIAEPGSARRSIPTIEKMRDFCLNLARASGRLHF